MTITSIGGIEFARELGCNLVVLARECSIKEIENIQAAGEASRTRHPTRHFLWKFSSMARCAWLTPASVSPVKRWADARPIAANAPKPAGCLTI